MVSFLIQILPTKAITQFKEGAENISQIDTLKPIKNKVYKQLILPITLMTYGIVGLESDFLKDFNLEIKEEVDENIKNKFSIDNYIQFTPTLAVYGLNLLGVKGKNYMAQRSILISASYLVMATSVYGLKTLAMVERPDGISRNSFPSGHTATAFASAEFLMQEYKHISIWIGIAGYTAATTTGVLRVYNGKHWVTDIAMGAGMGILSTKLAYWLTPKIIKNVFKSKSISERTSLTTNFSKGNQGVRLVINLR